MKDLTPKQRAGLDVGDFFKGPYRTSGLASTSEAKPSTWLRVLAVLTPDAMGSRWCWYRRAMGGRWATLWKRTYYSEAWERLGWQRVPECPFKTFGELRETSNGVRGECKEGECRCEVWS